MTTNQLVAEILNAIAKQTDLSSLVGVLISGLGSMFTALLGFGVKFLRDMSYSVDRLNTNIEVLIHKTDNHETRIDDHENRLRSFENKKEEGE